MFLLSGKTYFFKGKGYWQFDDYRMKVRHEQQRKSAVQWMGCRQTQDLTPDRRQYLKNSKRDEEVEDVTMDDEGDMYFEFEQPSKADSISILANKKLVTILLVMIMRMRK